MNYGLLVDRLLHCHCYLDLKLYSSLLQYSGCVQFKNKVDLEEVSIFYKSEKTEQSNCLVIKRKKVLLLYVIIAICIVFKLFCRLHNALGIVLK